MKRPSKWTWIWLSWLCAFVVLEIIAARSKKPKPRTLSEHLWRWFPWRWKRIALISGLVALVLHLGGLLQKAAHIPYV